MKKVSRKLLSMLLALVMVVSVMSVSALAADTGYSMTPYDSNVTSLEVTGANADVVSSTQCYQSVTVASTDTISISSGASYVYVNGACVTATTANPYTFTPNLSTGETMKIQIITQTGDRSAYVRVIEFVGA